MNITDWIVSEDRQRLEEILVSTGFFYDFEIKTALELADLTISQGMECSGYFWFKVIEEDQILAFACYGKNEFSIYSWELYWIVVHKDFRNRKLGRILLNTIENSVRQRGGKILWIETSGRPLYKPTEEFYKRNGYELQASLKDFYGPGDPKQIYAKTL